MTDETNARATGSPDAPATLEAATESTRDRIGRDVDAITQQLSPDRVKERAMSNLQNAQESVVSTVQDVADTVGEQARQAGSGLVDALRRHPLPAALIGLGVGLLAAGSVSAVRSTHDDYDSTSSGGYRADGSSSRYASGYDADYGTGYAAGTYGAGSHRTWDGPSERFEAGTPGGRPRQAARQASSRLEGWMDRSPLSVGAVALLVGAAIGFMAPGTRYEDDVMGERRDDLVDRARERVHDSVEVARESARKAGETLRSEIADRGVSAEGVRSSVGKAADTLLHGAEDVARKTAQDARQAGEEEARKRGLTAEKNEDESASDQEG